MGKLVYGVGINDANYVVSKHSHSKQVWVCPFYATWRGVIQRCYDTKFQYKHPTYINCKVCVNWLIFSKFKSWMEDQDYLHKHIDKDILGGGKLYSPNTCCFVESWLNNLFTGRSTSKSNLPRGVNYHISSGKFSARLNINGFRKSLGYFNTPEEAHQVYLQAKRVYVAKKMNGYPDQRIKQAVLSKVNQLCQCNWCNERAHS